MKRPTERLLAALARLAFWRKPAAPTLSPSPPPESGACDTTAADTPVAAAPADATDPAPSHHVLAMLARKSVWMPAVGVAVLALTGTLGAMLWQAGQRNAALQARLAASEKTLAPTRPAPATQPAPAVTAPKPVESSPVESSPVESSPLEPRIADAGTARPVKSAPAGGECDIGSREGVTLHLKDCIDAFNQGRARAGHGSR